MERVEYLLKMVRSRQSVIIVEEKEEGTLCMAGMNIEEEELWGRNSV